MVALPNQFTVFDATPNGQWNTTYTLTDNNGALMNIAGKTFEFVIRTSPTEPATVTPAVKVVSSVATAQGYITVTTAASTAQIVLTPAATAILDLSTSWVYALWMNPGLPDATPMVEGSFTVSPTAAA